MEVNAFTHGGKRVRIRRQMHLHAEANMFARGDKQFARRNKHVRMQKRTLLHVKANACARRGKQVCMQR